MKKIFLIVFFLVYTVVSAQFARIQDKDGFVNVREEANENAKILGKIHSNEMVFLIENEPEIEGWVYSFYKSKTKNELSGYIHSSRLNLLSNFTTIPFVNNQKQTMFFENKKENIRVEITLEDFDAQKNIHKFHQKEGFYDTYNKKEIWGTDGTLPNKHYKYIKINAADKTIEIPQKELENLFQPAEIFDAADFRYLSIYYDKPNDVLYISSSNSDGAGSYAVLFVIEKGVFKEKKVVIPF